jgi:hypothetical protein
MKVFRNNMGSGEGNDETASEGDAGKDLAPITNRRQYLDIAHESMH